MPRATRIQRACDGCRSRKIKCIPIPGNEQCQGCASLSIACTYVWPRRRRGPPNRLSQATTGSSSVSPEEVTSILSPASAVDAVNFTPPVAGLVSEEQILAIVDNWFELIHPVVPIFHRRHLRRRISSGELQQNPEFCGVVLSICATTVAVLPRRGLGSITVQEYLDFISQHNLIRGGFERCTYSLDWCLAMYNIAIAMTCIAKTHQTMIRAYHALGEAFAGVRYLAFFAMKSLDHLEQQLLTRLFWVLFAGSCAHLFGKIPIGLFPAEELQKFPRPLPLTDRQLVPALYMTPEQAGSTFHGDDTTYVPGLNFASDLYMVWHTAQSVRETVESHQSKVERIVNSLTPELRWRGGLSRPSTATAGHDIQVANIFVTSLHIRSNLMQRFGTRSDAQREQYGVILSDLWQILSHLPNAAFNANGSSLIPKIRDIAAAYLEQADLGGSPVDPTSPGNEVLMKILQRLDELDFWNNILFISHP